MVKKQINNKFFLLMLIQVLIVLPFCVGQEYQPDIGTFLLLHFNEGDTNKFNELYKTNLQGGKWVKEGVYGYALAQPQFTVPLTKELDLTGESFTFEFWYMPLSSNDGSRWTGSCNIPSGFITWGCEEDIYLWNSKMYAVHTCSSSKEATSGGWAEHIQGNRELEKGYLFS